MPKRIYVYKNPFELLGYNMLQTFFWIMTKVRAQSKVKIKLLNMLLPSSSLYRLHYKHQFIACLLINVLEKSVG